MFNLNILLRALLRCLMIHNSYEDTSIFIFSVWLFAGYITFPYNQIFFSPIPTSLQWEPGLTLNIYLISTLVWQLIAIYAPLMRRRV